MNFAAHRKITQFVCDLLGIPKEYAEIIVHASTFPDEVTDIKAYILKKWRREFAKHNFASFNHFEKVIGDSAKTAKSQGYCAGRDETFPLDLPNISIMCDETEWKRRCDTVTQHPLNALLDVLHRTSSCTALDEISYVSASNMADWLEKELHQAFDGVNFGPNTITYKRSFTEEEKQLVLEQPYRDAQLFNLLKNLEKIGSIDHLIEDGCTPAHARGQLLGEHIKWESGQEKWIDKFDLSTLKLPKWPATYTARQTIMRAAFISAKSFGVNEDTFKTQTALAIAAVSYYLKTIMAL